MLIGLTGLAGSGKSAVADILMRNFGFQRVKFADPLKNMLRTMLRGAGHDAADIERYLEGDLKEAVISGIGVTARRLMVTLGTEWGRDCISADLWIGLWAAQAERLQFVLADDVRFPNEVAAIRDRGGKIVEVIRPGVTAKPGAHVSEQLSVDPDWIIDNAGSLADLNAQVDTLARLHLSLTPCA